MPEYLLDALQRSVLFLYLLRQRGNEEIEITSRPTATVLRFEHEKVMSGRTRLRPINYSLLRILPLAGVAIWAVVQHAMLDNKSVETTMAFAGVSGLALTMRSG